MKEIITEFQHGENLNYIRELLKAQIHEWRIDRELGLITDDAHDIVNEVVFDLTVVDDAIKRHKEFSE